MKIPRLGDFHVPPRVVVITALAVPIGTAGALTAVALLTLIALVTNLCFHGVLSLDTTTPGSTRGQGQASLWLMIDSALISAATA